MTGRALLLDLPHLWVGERRPSGPRHITRPPGQLLREAMKREAAAKRMRVHRHGRRFDVFEPVMSAIGQDTGHVKP